jgi:hypothetical protein
VSYLFDLSFFPGLALTTNIIGATFVAFLFIGVFTIFGLKRTHNFTTTQAIYVVSTILLVALTSIFLITIVIANISAEDRRFQAVFLKDEFLNGGLSLRFASLFSALGCIFAFVRFVTEQEDSLNPETDKTFRPWLQLGFYCAVCLVLWVYKIKGIELLPQAIMSWSILFIIDDWAILHYYLRAHAIPIHLDIPDKGRSC